MVNSRTIGGGCVDGRSLGGRQRSDAIGARGENGLQLNNDERVRTD